MYGGGLVEGGTRSWDEWTSVLAGGLLDGIVPGVVVGGKSFDLFG